MNDGGYLYSSGSINRLSDCIKQKGSAGRESERRFNMAIAVSENGRIFTIHTASTTYQMMADNLTRSLVSSSISHGYNSKEEWKELSKEEDGDDRRTERADPQADWSMKQT